MPHDVDALVIGAGVVGLAIARGLSMAGRDVLVVDAADAIGTGTSSRNSEVIHAGIYYEPGSLKARLCVEGKRLLYQFCAESGVEARRLGKLIVSQTSAEEPKLEALKKVAEQNGVADLVWLTSHQARQLEPDLSCTAALLSPSTGIIDSHSYMLALQAVTEANGGTVALRTTVTAGACVADGFRVNLRDSSASESSIHCRIVINSAGHGAHAVAAALHGYDKTFLPPRFIAKGSYCNVSGPSPFRRLIYPIPVPGALGIHVTLDLQGRARLGPNIEWVDQENYSVSESIIPEFQQACVGFWPGIANRTLTTAYCGLRPKVHGPDKASADFIIQGPAQHGVNGLVNLFGIESPGLTSSLAIARVVCGLA